MTPRTRRLVRALEKASRSPLSIPAPLSLYGFERAVAARALRWAKALYSQSVSPQGFHDALRDAINALEGRDGR